MWNIDKLIEALKFRDCLEKVVGKRPGVPRLPAQLYLRLMVASIATEKDIATCISTALEVYTMKNQEKHFDEIKIKAAAAGKTLEDYLADEIADRLSKTSNT